MKDKRRARPHEACTALDDEMKMTPTTNPIKPVSLRATCSHTSPIMIRDGAVVCATCAAPILTEVTSDSAIYTTRRPPSETTPRVFREWCAAGKVEGAERNADGVWSCTAAAWRTARRKPATVTMIVTHDAPPTDDEVLATLPGMRSTRRAG